MGKSYTKEYEIHYYEVDYKLKCKLTAMIDFISDVATQQAELLNVGIDYLNENNCSWVFYKYDINIYRYPSFGERVSITTEPVGLRTFYGPRKYIIKDSNNNLIGEATALFFLINTERRRPMRVPEYFYNVYEVDKNIKYEIDTEKLNRVNEKDYEKEFNIRYSDIDSNQHVNNGKYVEWAIEAVPIEVVTGYEIRNIKVVFEKETTYGNKIVASATVKKVNDNKLKSYHTIEASDGLELTLMEIEWERC